MTFLMCNSFLLIHAKAVLGYFRSLPLSKKQAVAGILPNQAIHSKVLLEDCLLLCFLIHVWMPGVQRQNEITRETAHYEGRTDCNSLPTPLLIHGWAHPVLSPWCCGTFGSWLTKAMGHLGSLLLQSSAETWRNLSQSLRASVPKWLMLFQSRSQERTRQNYFLSAPIAGQGYLFSLTNGMVLTKL